MAHFNVFKGKNKQWYWHFVGNNGEIMSQSEGYRTRYGARRGAKRFSFYAARAEIIFK